jgi:hypothetical protein
MADWAVVSTKKEDPYDPWTVDWRNSEAKALAEAKRLVTADPQLEVYVCREMFKVTAETKVAVTEVK